ncbi:MAG: universal stress protein, partial [Cyclonatronaceae bacterium]
ILERLGSNTELSVTLFTVCEEHEKARSQTFLSEIKGLFTNCEIVEKVVVSATPSKAILDELSKDYELLLLGATEKVQGSDTLFNPMVDELIRSAPCPTLVIHGSRVPQSWNPHRIMIPTNGSAASKRAADIAFYIASSDPRQEMIVLNVVEQEDENAQMLHESRLENRKYHMSRQFVDGIKKIGDSYGIETQAMVEIGKEVETTISEIAKNNKIDLIVIGTSVRPGSARLFIGPKVERLLSQAPCPVIVYND